MAIARLRIDTEIELSIEKAAEWFAGLNDDEQARFFVEVAKLANDWPGGAESQWWYLGGHLRNCECSTHEARQMIRQIADAVETSTHGLVT